MLRLVRRLFWLSAASAAAVGGWSLWKVKGTKEEPPSNDWTPIKGSGSDAKSSDSKQQSASSSANKRAANGTSGGVATATRESADGAGSKPSQAPQKFADTKPTKKSNAETATKASQTKPDSATADADTKAPSKATKSGGDQRWVEPDSNGSCPADFAVKANDGSKIFHVPGGRSYSRTKAERCYASPDDAAADGYRAAKV